MEDEPQIESGEDRNPGEVTLLQIRFEKNPNQKLKYLEGEPKILGVTQIAFAVFFTIMVVMFYMNGMDKYADVVMVVGGIASMIIIIAGSLAIAAQNLHLPTLKACLGMQVVACMASVITIFIQISILPPVNNCWASELESPQMTTCKSFNTGFENYLGIQKLVMTVHIALSATIAAYCCKAIQFCSPVSNVPVITVNGPPNPQ
ncbi:membrane-spanning 4-domains subfamily A member 4D isoform X2 [Carassius auratus]|uniref:Membrane-spanning 4-domains subfamily A member 4D isoform X2 n=1 Tax=Carassius auratus TaxID=7957 RepID=A0A6P6NEY9_CARAU|nr:membrane-spanning 4-domains subfamily A member 4D-like isoform X2 [Carassius auratus]XP_052416915.1 membrane-spanning 4-domains subfamily A member 4D isoform X2 [Carassius gibelio]